MDEDALTLGIEEEFQIVGPDGELRAHIEAVMERAFAISDLGDLVKPEFLQSTVEVGTKVCRDVAEARVEITRMRRGLATILDEAGLRLVSAGTHPFSRWQDQQVTEKERYHTLEQEMQDVARELLIFGMHVHIGIPDPELRIDIFNEARYFLPHLLALSASSPFWMGRDTGLKSYRSVVWSRFPRTGIPPHFESWAEWQNYVQLLQKTNSLPDPSKIWWDLRPHGVFPTIEFRICDAATRIDETICLAAIIQAFVAKLIKLRQQNLGFRTYAPKLIRENKWRAMRMGIEGKLIDFGKQEEVPEPDLIEEIIGFVDDVVDDLGSRKEVEYARTILREGTSAERQLRIFRETGDLQKVVDHLAEETVAGTEPEVVAEAPALED
ncbi:MAG TPA: carboxylate-amine ligase [Actinomycetota bacterium]|nr:carboxylate-amine ligase [Actinomycetota bacterium]